nr:proline-rich receptor-like protein kinase PERK2 [Penaeus vannamei]
MVKRCLGCSKNRDLHPHSLTPPPPPPQAPHPHSLTPPPPHRIHPHSLTPPQDLHPHSLTPPPPLKAPHHTLSRRPPPLSQDLHPHSLTPPLTGSTPTLPHAFPSVPNAPLSPVKPRFHCEASGLCLAVVKARRPLLGESLMWVAFEEAAGLVRPFLADQQLGSVLDPIQEAKARECKGNELKQVVEVYTSEK